MPSPDFYEYSGNVGSLDLTLKGLARVEVLETFPESRLWTLGKPPYDFAAITQAGVLKPREHFMYQIAFYPVDSEAPNAAHIRELIGTLKRMFEKGGLVPLHPRLPVPMNRTKAGYAPSPREPGPEEILR